MKLKAKPIPPAGNTIEDFKTGDIVICTKCPNGGLDDGSAYIVTDDSSIVQITEEDAGIFVDFDAHSFKEALFVPAELYLED